MNPTYDPSGKPVQIHVLGPMSVIFRNGDIRTPRSRKACALLALLALAPRGERTRVWLRDKLWSSSDEHKSSTCLRQTVFELKRDLGDLASRVLVINRQTIGLDLNTVWIDVREIQRDPRLLAQLDHTPETQVLEGMDIADEEFEDWLQMERQTWIDRLEKLQQHAGPIPHSVDPVPAPVAETLVMEEKPIFSLGFLPSIQQGCNENTLHLADSILEGVANNLQEFAPLKIYDFRDMMMGSDCLMNACETEYYIRIRVLQLRDTITLTFFLYQTSSMRLDWSQSIQAPAAEVETNANGLVSSFVSQMVDRLAKSLFSESTSAPLAFDNINSVSFTALNMMFQLDDNALQNTEKLLQTANNASASPIYPALQSYLLSFKVGENLGEFDDRTVDEVRRHINAIVSANPFNSLVLACLGHVVGYVFKDHLAASELFNRALQINPNQAFVWDHYALHKLYIGECEAAYAASRRAVQLGGYSPIRFSYDTTLCMTSMLSGHLEQAVVAGKSALGKQPRFTAAMRYLTASYSLLGRVDNARGVFETLLKVDPDFELPEVRKNRFRISDPDVENRVLTAFELL
ncbi:MAG: SARP family transcriptional regulator [Roseibium sp.]